MATLKAPFALDRSLNTTEETSRNIADVLAEGLSHITGRTASEVEYDNTDSGLTSDNVQGAIDELSERPTLPTTDIQTAVDEFETYNGGLLSSCKVALSPNQDLHGYSEPWVGGARKNKVPLTLNNLKAINTNGTWSGSDYTYRGVTYSVLTDDADNVLGIKANGQATQNSPFILWVVPIFSGTCILSGCPANGSVNTYHLQYSNYVNYTYEQIGTDVSVTQFDAETYDNARMQIIVNANYTANNLIFTPMLRASGASADYEPYENICPISGHTQVEVGDDGKNKADPNTLEVGYYSTTGYNNNPNFKTTAPILVKEGETYSGSVFNSNVLTERYNVVFTTFSSSDTTNALRQVVAGSITIQEGEKYVRVRNNSDQTALIVSGNFAYQLELGSTATAYEPYNGYQVTVNLGGTYYSGTLDVVSGVLTVDKVKAVTPTRGSLDSSGKLYTISFSGGTIHNYSDTVIATPYVMCSHLDVDSLAGARDTQRKCICQYAGAVYIGGYVGEETALDNMLALADFSIVFELATPTPIQLSPTMVKALVGENHLSAPLEGQEITESKYRELFTWDEVEAYVNAHSGVTYSTEERVVGTWIDSKPLYQKTITHSGALVVDNSFSNDIGTLANVDQFVKCEGYFRRTDANGLMYSLNGGTRPESDVNIYKVTTRFYNGQVQVAVNGYNDIEYIALTVQYTKTTD